MQLYLDRSVVTSQLLFFVVETAYVVVYHGVFMHHVKKYPHGFLTYVRTIQIVRCRYTYLRIRSEGGKYIWVFFRYPTDPFKIFELQNLSHDVLINYTSWPISWVCCFEIVKRSVGYFTSGFSHGLVAYASGSKHASCIIDRWIVLKQMLPPSPFQGWFISRNVSPISLTSKPGERARDWL